MVILDLNAASDGSSIAALQAVPNMAHDFNSQVSQRNFFNNFGKFEKWWLILVGFAS